MAKPRHIAVIMDGNGRWAKRRFLPRIAGYPKGVDAARNLVQMCVDHKIEILSLFAFSSENWHRPPQEITTLMNLCLKLLTEEINDLHKHQIKLQVIGDIVPLSLELKNAISFATNLTANNNGLKLNIAINYGGRWDLMQAMQQVATKIQTSNLKVTDIDEQLISSHLSLGDLPDPDLFIRTSGEQRISNFFLWQSAYSELFFTDTLWPDFAAADFKKALDFFNSRARKFGGILEKVNA